MLTVKQAKELGVVFVEGDLVDWFIASNDILDRINELSNWDGLTVTSFTTRKHTGDEIPCNENLPVIVTDQHGSSFGSFRLMPNQVNWTYPNIKSWKPDLEVLEKLVNEKEEKPMDEKQYTYELVTDLSTNEIAKAMIDGEVFYTKNGKCHYKWDGSNFVTNNDHFFAFNQDFYRRKEIETITRTITYPKPVSEPLKNGEEYRLVINTKSSIAWKGDKQDMSWLSQGLIHLSEENAQAHWDALFGG